MRIVKQRGKKYILLMLLAVAVMALVACGAEEGEETAEPLGGEFQETPFLEDTPMSEETPLIEEETPLIEETAAVEETPMLEETPEEEATPTMEPEATEPADDETPQTGATVTQTQMVRSDVLLDLTVAGQDGAELGEVRDVLFDMQGNVQYLLLDLALDEARTVAVTWDQVEVQHASELTTGADDVADDELVVVYLGQQTELETMAELDVDILNAEGDLVNLADLNLDATTNVAEGQALQASEFDYDLINQNDDDLGEVEELVVNVAEGRVVYAIVNVGGFLGIGETTVALPWSELQFSEADEAFIVNADEDTLTDAPTVDFDEWDNGIAPDVDWGAEVEEFWNSIGGSS
ncbi:MAG TPA: PRC-barrel domain-containing protein [Candidatus Sulfomarinibacteraceae bacterium]|nr:PRC-barrel domain-containing protein [Candidatus Sulfomarinibacteraceae bacterium]